MLAGSLLVACTVNAQEYTPVYPQYSLGSNWSIGGKIIYNHEFMMNAENRHGLGIGVFGEKELNYVWDVRFALDVNQLIKLGDRGHDKFAKAGVDFKFSLNNWWKGYYDPERKWNFYIFPGAGFTGLWDGDYDLGHVGMYLQLGLGMSYQCGDHHTFFAEAYEDLATDVPNPFTKFDNWHNTDLSLAIGYMYNFGPTQADLDMLAQRAMLTQENLDAKEKEIEGLRNDLRNAKNREDKLISRIAELEAGQTNGQGGRGTIINNADNAVADSLRRIIEGYETNKHNFYALPFSILYGIDEYTVSEDQMNKINAIAQIMKDNKDVNFEIIGYCDYSGSDAYNQKLSERRAENVKKLLVRKGVSEDRLTTSGKGKSMSFGDIKNAINRRVSFYRSNN